MKQFKMKLKNKNGGSLSMLLGTLGANLVGNFLAGKGMNRAWEGFGLELVIDLQSKTRIFNTASSFN